MRHSSSVCMQVMGINSHPCIFSVRAIRLIQKVCDQMEHLINPHVPDPVCQPCADCQYGANVSRWEERKLRKRESDECFHRSCVTHTGSLLSKPDGHATHQLKVCCDMFSHFQRLHWCTITPIPSHRLTAACLVGLGLCHHYRRVHICKFKWCFCWSTLVHKNVKCTYTAAIHTIACFISLISIFRLSGHHTVLSELMAATWWLINDLFIKGPASLPKASLQNVRLAGF